MVKKHILFLLSFLLLSHSALALCVQNEWANLRSSPSTGAAKTWRVYRYMPFKVLKRQQKWFQVSDLDGDRHWIYRPLISEQYKCAVTTQDKTVVRSGPGETFEETEWSPVKRYYSVKVLQIKEGWVEFSDIDDDTGWIAEDDLWMP